MFQAGGVEVEVEVVANILLFIQDLTYCVSFQELTFLHLLVFCLCVIFSQGKAYFLSPPLVIY